MNKTSPGNFFHLSGYVIKFVEIKSLRLLVGRLVAGLICLLISLN